MKYKIVALIAIVILVCPLQSSASSIDGYGKTSNSVFRVLSSDGTTVGTAFLFEYNETMFKKRTSVLTAAHVIRGYNPGKDDFFIQIGEKHSEATIRLAVERVTQVLLQKGVNLDSANKYSIPLLETSGLKERVCSKLSCKPLSANYLNLEMDAQKIRFKPFSNLTSEEQLKIKKLHQLLLVELFPTFFPKKPRLRINNFTVLSNQDDIAILEVEHPEVLDERRGFIQADSLLSASEILGRKIVAYNYGVFKSIFTENLLYGRGHICAVSEKNPNIFYAFIGPLNSGSSGSPVTLEADEQQVIGVTLSQVINSTDASTGIYEVLNISRVKELLDKYIFLNINKGNENANPKFIK